MERTNERRDRQANPTRDNERRLQRWIVESPSELLPGIASGATAVATEVRMPGAGRADVVVVDRNGAITIVECKLARNPEIRRSVIGQVLSYAAALWKLDLKDLERAFAAAGSSLTKPFRDGKEQDWDVEAFRGNVSKNLAAGSFRLIIAVDEMNEKQERKLERGLAFINNLNAKKLQALALVLIPGDDGNPRGRVIGDNGEVIGPLRPSWKADRWALVDKISDPDDRQLADELLDWAEERDLDLQCRETRARVKVRSKQLFRISDSGKVRVYLEGLRDCGGAEEVERMRDVLAGIDKRFETEDDRPTAPLDALSDEGKQLFLTSMERYLRIASNGDSA